MDVIEV